LTGQADKGVRHHLANDGANPLFVRRIAERPQQRDREGLNTGLDQFAHRAAHALFVKRNERTPGLVDALAHFPDKRPRDDRIGIAPAAVTSEMLDWDAGGKTHQPLQC